MGWGGGTHPHGWGGVADHPTPPHPHLWGVADHTTPPPSMGVADHTTPPPSMGWGGGTYPHGWGGVAEHNPIEGHSSIPRKPKYISVHFLLLIKTKVL